MNLSFSRHRSFECEFLSDFIVTTGTFCNRNQSFHHKWLAPPCGWNEGPERLWLTLTPCVPLKVVQSVKICTNINAHLVSNGPDAWTSNDFNLEKISEKWMKFTNLTTSIPNWLQASYQQSYCSVLLTLVYNHNVKQSCW